MMGWSTFTGESLGLIFVRTPSRLHFGLLSYHPESARQFGGVGLMVRRPDVAIRAERTRGEACEGRGVMSDRAAMFAERFNENAVAMGLIDEPIAARIDVLRMPRPHCGFGTGTQLGLAVARAMAQLAECDDLDTADLSRMVGRGLRSAIGAHGGTHGGLIVDGGKADSEQLSPMVARLDFPTDWPIVLIRPQRLVGISGERERAAFAKMPPLSPGITERMCRLVLLGLLPAVMDEDVEEFGESLYELQQLAGECFKAEQGGTYADPMLARIVGAVRRLGIAGVGQSSWGPTLYAITRDPEQARRVAATLEERFDIANHEITITYADNAGSSVSSVTGSAARKAPLAVQS